LNSLEVNIAPVLAIIGATGFVVAFAMPVIMRLL